MVQFYPDQRPGPEAADFRCRPVSTDGHSGSDFRLRHLSEMRGGVAVLAAAGGTVKLARDAAPDGEMPDEEETDPRAINGNAVVIDHGEGWQTRYNHLRQGSLQVHAGEEIPRGTVLGEVGLSGRTNFPHVHFEVIYRGRILDPFTGGNLEDGCGEGGTALWHDDAWAYLPGEPGGLLDSGFSTRALTPDQIRAGPPRLAVARPRSANLLFWASSWALRAGDRDKIEVRGPDGEVLAKSEKLLETHRDDWVRTLTIPAPAGGWPIGVYSGSYRVFRDGDDYPGPFIDAKRVIEVR